MGEITMEEKKDNLQFKMLYMLGMILVLCGHYGSGILNFGGIFQYDTFHIPMFMFASGYFYKSKYENSLNDVIAYSKKKICHLLLPYYAWDLIYYIFAYVFQRRTEFRIYHESGFKITNFLVEPFQLSSGATYNVAAWFLMALFLCQIVNNVTRYMVSRIKILNVDIVITVITSILAVWAIKMSSCGWNTQWKLTICRTSYLVFYYNLGYIYKNYIEKFTEKINDIIVLIFSICANLLLIYRYGDKIPVCYNMTFDVETNPVYYIIRAILGISFWMVIAKIIADRLGKNKLCIYYANHTFSLMMHQGIAGLLVNGILIKIMNKEQLLDAYYTQIWFNPLEGIQRAWLPIFVSIIVLVVVKGYDIFFMKVKNVKNGHMRM